MKKKDILELEGRVITLEKLEEIKRSGLITSVVNDGKSSVLDRDYYKIYIGKEEILVLV